jgi:hypothetical protein
VQGSTSNTRYKRKDQANKAPRSQGRGDAEPFRGEGNAFCQREKQQLVQKTSLVGFPTWTAATWRSFSPVDIRNSPVIAFVEASSNYEWIGPHRSASAPAECLSRAISGNKIGNEKAITSVEGFMPVELVPTAGGPDVLPNPVPAPDPEPPKPDPAPEPSPIPPVPEPAPAM